jgi:hypothetical protein
VIALITFLIFTCFTPFLADRCTVFVPKYPNFVQCYDISKTSRHAPYILMTGFRVYPKVVG